MIKFKPINKSHLDNLCFIEETVFDKNNFPMNKRTFIYHIKKGNFLYGAFKNDELIGYILCFEYKKTARIYSIAVMENFRNQGIAKTLINKALEYFKEKEKITLEVRVDNQQAIKLYNKIGFKKIKLIKNYYLDGCDAIKMELVINYK